MKVLRIVLLCSCLASAAGADDAPYVEYRCVRALGRIQITTGFIERSPDLGARAQGMEASGIIVLESDAGRLFARSDTLGGRAIETTLSIAPPVGHGEGGASSSVDIRVVLGGDTLLECPLVDGSGGLDEISIDPGRRYVSLLGHRGALHFDGFESRHTIDAEWLARRAQDIEKLLCGSRGRSK